MTAEEILRRLYDELDTETISGDTSCVDDPYYDGYYDRYVCPLCYGDSPNGDIKKAEHDDNCVYKMAMDYFKE